MKTHYELLEVPPDAPLEEISKSYFRLASKCHPDLVQQLDSDIQKLANEKMRDLNIAYQVLKNLEDRARYDQELMELEKPSIVEEEPPTPSPAPPPQVERKKTPYPWDLVKEASLDRLKETLARSSLSLKPVEFQLNPFNRIFEGKKGLTHFIVLIRIEETITPTVLTQTLSGLSLPHKVKQNWNPLQKTHSLVCLMGWGFNDLALLKKKVQNHNRSLLEEKRGQKKDQRAFIVLLDFTTEQIYAPDLSPAVSPLFAVLKEFSFQGK
jgi:hypothetical protein